jgi:hypothetical protein
MATNLPIIVCICMGFVKIATNETLLHQPPSQFMKHIKQHLFHPKTHQAMCDSPLGGQIAGYFPHFWMKNALYSVCPKSHWVNAVVS